MGVKAGFSQHHRGNIGRIEGKFRRRGADFLLCLSGAEDSRLLVQARYEALRENYLASTSGEDPFADPPAADSSLFVPIGMVTERTGVLTE